MILQAGKAYPPTLADSNTKLFRQQATRYRMKPTELYVRADGDWLVGNYSYGGRVPRVVDMAEILATGSCFVKV